MQRRGELLAKIASQREQVADVALRWRGPLSIADNGLRTVRFLRSNPVLVAAAVTIIMIRRNGLAGMAATGWRMWKLYRSALSFSAKIAARSR